MDDIVACHRRLEPLVDAVEVNISSPNTAGLRVFHDTRVLAELLGAVSEQRSRPLFVKMPPFPERDMGRRASRSDLVTCGSMRNSWCRWTDCRQHSAGRRFETWRWFGWAQREARLLADVEDGV